MLEYLFGLYLLTLASVVFLPLVLDPAMRAHLLIDRGWISLVPLATVTELLRKSSAQEAAVQLLGNMALFVPLGLLGPMLFQRMRKFAALLSTAALCTLGIEVTQLLLHLGHFSFRSFDVDDVLLNMSGALIGFAAWTLVSNLSASRLTSASS
jgi:glycopeptide antibiotics resistance protein